MFQYVLVFTLFLLHGMIDGFNVNRQVTPIMSRILSCKKDSSFKSPFSSNFQLFEKKITKEGDKNKDYFESEFDRQPVQERLPLALGFLGIVSLPFLVGLIYLYTSK